MAKTFAFGFGFKTWRASRSRGRAPSMAVAKTGGPAEKMEHV